jgi:hypothetical protein
MPNITTVFQNEHRWQIEGQVDLDSAAAVGASRGTNMVWARTGAGIYTCTVKGNNALSMYEVLKSNAWFSDPTLGGAVDARVESISQSTSNDNITITIHTYSTASGNT